MSDVRPNGYLPRVVDGVVDRYLRLFGAILIEGTKWCGKTWTSREHAQSIVYVDREQNAEIARADPESMLMGPRPRVIDEWQAAPEIWNATRHAVDDLGRDRGAWILTGSASPSHDSSRHSGAGRFGRIRMFPMSLLESGDSTGEVSLSGLFRGEFACTGTEGVGFEKVVELVCRGGWPQVLGLPLQDARAISRQYLNAVLDESVPNAGKSAETARRLLYSLARNLGQSATYKTLAVDMSGGEEGEYGIASTTIPQYLDLFRSMFLTEDIRGWAPAARSPKRLQTKPKRYFADPSLAVAALGMGDKALRSDWQTLGLAFENLCLRDLLVYASALPDIGSEPVRYYRDDSGLEVDAIIELADGRWAAIEIKLSHDKAADGLDNLARLKKKLVDKPGARTPEPEFMAVVTGIGGRAYRAGERMYVIPITALGA